MTYPEAVAKLLVTLLQGAFIAAAMIGGIYLLVWFIGKISE
jgi:hypothetical protein